MYEIEAIANSLFYKGSLSASKTETPLMAEGKTLCPDVNEDLKGGKRMKVLLLAPFISATSLFLF